MNNETRHGLQIIGQRGSYASTAGMSATQQKQVDAEVLRGQQSGGRK